MNTCDYFDTEFYAALIESIQDGVFVVKDSQFILVNQAFAKMLGENKEALIGMQFSDKIAPEYVELVAQRYNLRKQGKQPPNEYQIEVLHTSGSRLVCQLKVETFRSKEQLIYVVCTLKDVTAYTQLINKLRQSEAEFKQIIEKLPGIFYRTDAAGNLSMASPYALSMLGYTPEEALGLPLTHFYAEPQERKNTLKKICELKGKPVAVETLMRCKDGSTVWVSTSAYARFDSDNNFLGVEGISLNITQRKKLEHDLRDLAVKDALTQLANRFGLFDYLDKALNRAHRQRSQISLVFIDLDDFKRVNDQFGHICGDRFLVEFAQRLEECFRLSDIVARIGGDEFVILLDDNTLKESIKNLLSRLDECMQPPIIVGGHELTIKYSYGVAVYPKHGTNAEELLEYADKQMYVSKKISSN